MAGTLKIQNVSGASYAVEELGGLAIADQATIDLLDPLLSPHYTDWDAANRLVTELPTAKLYQDIQAGRLTIIENASYVITSFPSL